MDKTQNMLQTVINSQSAMKSELLEEMGKLRKEMSKGFTDVNTKIDKVDKKLTARIDKIGLAEAKLEDDAPTVEEFYKLEKRVIKLEQKVAAI